MRVAELIERLKAFPPDATVALSSMGHHYDSSDHETSHGPMQVLAFNRNRVIICSDTSGHYRENARALCAS